MSFSQWNIKRIKKLLHYVTDLMDGNRKIYENRKMGANNIAAIVKTLHAKDLPSLTTKHSLIPC